MNKLKKFLIGTLLSLCMVSQSYSWDIFGKGSLEGMTGGTVTGDTTFIGTFGAEKVTNGNFTTNCTGWTSTGWTCAGGATPWADHNTGNTTLLEQDVSAVAWETYKVVFTIGGRTAGAVMVKLGDNTSDAKNTNTTHTIYITAEGTGNLQFDPTTDFDGYIDSVSVTKITSGTLAVGGIVDFHSPVKFHSPIQRDNIQAAIFETFHNKIYDAGFNTADFYLYLNSEGTYAKFDGIKNNITLSSGTGNYTITELNGYTSIPTLTGTGRSHTITDLRQYLANNTIPDGNTNTYTGTGTWSGFTKIPFACTACTMNLTDVAGFYLTGAETKGTNNYGVLLKGDGIGAGITFGSGKDDSIFHDGTYLQSKVTTGTRLVIGSTTRSDFIETQTNYIMKDAMGYEPVGTGVKKWFYRVTLGDNVNGTAHLLAGNLDFSTCETATDTFTAVGHGMQVGQQINNGSDTGCGLLDSEIYYVCTVESADTVTLVMTNWANCPATKVNVVGTAGVSGMTMVRDTIKFNDPASYGTAYIQIATDRAEYSIDSDGVTSEFSEQGAGGKFEAVSTNCTGSGGIYCIYDGGNNAYLMNDVGSSKTVIIEMTYN